MRAINKFKNLINNKYSKHIFMDETNPLSAVVGIAEMSGYQY